MEPEALRTRSPLDNGREAIFPRLLHQPRTRGQGVGTMREISRQDQMHPQTKTSQFADIESNHAIVFFDGLCNLCSGLVQYLLRCDSKDVLRFASLQSEFAKAVLPNSLNDGDAGEADSIIVLYRGRFYQKSDAVLQIARVLGWPWSTVCVCRMLPAGWRDRRYDWVASNRYRWFGKRTVCMRPTSDLRRRFLD